MTEPTEKLSASLEARQWDQVFVLLAEVSAPYRVTQPIIQALHAQLVPPQPQLGGNVVPMGEASD